MNIEEVEGKLRGYVCNQLTEIARTNPPVGLIKPFITRALDKKIGQMNGFLEMIADDNGEIDVNGILTEMITSITESQPFKMNAPVLGDIEIGGGSVKISLPFIDKQMSLNSADLINFKNFMLKR